MVYVFVFFIFCFGKDVVDFIGIKGVLEYFGGEFF